VHAKLQLRASWRSRHGANDPSGGARCLLSKDEFRNLMAGSEDDAWQFLGEELDQTLRSSPISRSAIIKNAKDWFEHNAPKFRKIVCQHRAVAKYQVANFMRQRRFDHQIAKDRDELSAHGTFLATFSYSSLQFSNWRQ
jgi:hypothetical protein